MKITIERDEFIFVPESSIDYFHLGQMSKNVFFATKVYTHDTNGGISEFKKLVIHKNTVINNFCGE